MSTRAELDLLGVKRKRRKIWKGETQESNTNHQTKSCFLPTHTSTISESNTKPNIRFASEGVRVSVVFVQLRVRRRAVPRPGLAARNCSSRLLKHSCAEAYLVTSSRVEWKTSLDADQGSG